MRSGSVLAALLIAGAATAFAPEAAHAQRWGLQASWGTEADLGLGGRIEHDVPNFIAPTGALSRTWLAGTFDWFFPSCDRGGCTHWQVNANMAVPFTLTGIDPYAGTGLNVSYSSQRVARGVDDGDDIDESRAKVGINFLAGGRFAVGGLSAFGEGRFIVAGEEQFVITFGVLLGRVGGADDDARRNR